MPEALKELKAQRIERLKREKNASECDHISVVTALIIIGSVAHSRNKALACSAVNGIGASDGAVYGGDPPQIGRKPRTPGKVNGGSTCCQGR